MDDFFESGNQPKDKDVSCSEDEPTIIKLKDKITFTEKFKRENKQDIEEWEDVFRQICKIAKDVSDQRKKKDNKGNNEPS